MSRISIGLNFFFSALFAVSLVSAETVTLNAISGTGTGPIAFEAEGATNGDDCSAAGGTASSYTGKVPNKRLYVPVADTTLTENDTIYFVQVRVLAKADVNMNGTYDGIRIALRVRLMSLTLRMPTIQPCGQKTRSLETPGPGQISVH